MVHCKIVSNWNQMTSEERDIFVRDKFTSYRELGFDVMEYDKLIVISLEGKALVWSDSSHHKIATIVKFEKYLKDELDRNN